MFQILFKRFVYFDSIKITSLVEIPLITNYRNFKESWLIHGRQFIDMSLRSPIRAHTEMKPNSDVVIFAWILDIFSSPFYVP